LFLAVQQLEQALQPQQVAVAVVVVVPRHIKLLLDKKLILEIS
jgi:hypothetical protein